MILKSKRLHHRHNYLSFDDRQKSYISEDEHAQLTSGERIVPGKLDLSRYPTQKQIGARVFRVASDLEDSCRVEYSTMEEWLDNWDAQGERLYNEINGG